MGKQGGMSSQKRDRERRKAEKAAQKREKKELRKLDPPQVSDAGNLEGLIVPGSEHADARSAVEDRPA